MEVKLGKILVLMRDQDNTNQRNFHGFRTKLQDTFWSFREKFY